MEEKKVPVLFLIFKRKDQAISAFEPIRQYKPTKLYIAADGPRNTVEGEKQMCDETRRTILEMIDWPCELKTLFRDKNLGCADAVYGGISWFFDNEEYGIINEDDVVLAPDFFQFCEKILPLYCDKKQVMVVSSRNHSCLYQESDEYVFSYYVNIWGWATWRRAWKMNTNTFDGWDKYPKRNLIKRYGLFQGLMTIWYYNKCSNPNNEFGCWDYTWCYNIMKNNGLALCPKVNLSSNIGITVSGANSKAGDVDPYSHLKVGRIKWPLRILNDIVVDPEIQKADRKDFYRLRIIGTKKKLKRLINL